MTLIRTFVVALLLASIHGVVRAEEPPRVGVWAYEEASALRPRLVAELRVRGYATIEIRDPGAIENLDAAVWLSDEPAHARICSLSSTPRCEEITDADTSVLLIRIVEAVRAELASRALASGHNARPPQLVDSERPATPAAVSPTPEVVPPPPPPFVLALSPSLALPLRGLSTSVHVAMHVEWHVQSRLALEVGAGTRILAPSVSDSAGTAVVNTSHAWLGGRAVVLGDPTATHLAVGVGIGVGNATINAQATAPFVEHTASEWFFSAVSRIQVRAPLSSRVFVDVGADAIVALPAPVVVFAGRDVAHVFQPHVALSAAIAIQL